MRAARNRTAVRVLVAIPHFYGAHGIAAGSSLDDREARAAMVARTVTCLHEHFGATHEVFPWHRRALPPVGSIDVVLVTSGDDHLVSEIADLAPLFRHEHSDVPAPELPVACQRVLADGSGSYDYYCYVEDDMIVADPLLFAKTRWFCDEFGDDALLMPNRFERTGGLKIYPDGPLSVEETERFQDLSDRPELHASALGIDVVFRRPSNPNAGVYFLSGVQLERWATQPYFGVASDEFVASIESGANLGIMRTFRVYKPAEPTADFLEVEHGTKHYLDQWAIPGPLHAVSAAYLHASAERAQARSAHESLLRSPTFRITAPVRKAWRSIRPRRRPV